MRYWKIYHFNGFTGSDATGNACPTKPKYNAPVPWTWHVHVIDFMRQKYRKVYTPQTHKHPNTRPAVSRFARPWLQLKCARCTVPMYSAEAFGLYIRRGASHIRSAFCTCCRCQSPPPTPPLLPREWKRVWVSVAAKSRYGYIHFYILYMWNVCMPRGVT